MQHRITKMDVAYFARVIKAKGKVQKAKKALLISTA